LIWQHSRTAYDLLLENSLAKQLIIRSA